MDGSTEDADSIAEWVRNSFADGDERKGAERVVAWTMQSELMGSVIGDSFSVAFAHLPASARWLEISVLERAVIVRFDKLKGYPPFVDPARSRLMKKMELDGFLETGRTLKPKGGKIEYAKVELAPLKDEYQWKLLEWRLNLVAELAGGSHRSQPQGSTS